LQETRGRVTERDPAAKKPRERRRPTLPKFQQKRRAGRPPIYEEAFGPRARKLALLGFTEVEIAAQFGINPDTLTVWKRNHPEFSVALDSGKAEADAEVAASLFERATGAKVPAVKIFLGPVGKEGESPQPIYAPYTQYHPPETGAAKLWLTNRQPERWRERKEIEHMGSLEHRISLMTPEQRRARLRELQAKAADVIDGEAEEVGPEFFGPQGPIP
jgi:hypothetical protein